MFKKVLLPSLCILLLLVQPGFSYDRLNVQDPQQTWQYGQGTIEEAVVSIKPQGIYMEYGLYLTFSAKGLGFSGTKQLEVQFYFDLPQDAIVHDSWLWVDNEIIRGKIMDKWTAASIYENIVSRQRDPSILYKRGGGSYELRIYPMKGNESRKVKITYLVPTQWNSNRVTASLPTNLLRTSRTPVQKFYILTWTDDEWKNPGIVEFPDISFQEYNNEALGNYQRAVFPSNSIQNSLNFAMDSPLRNGIYVKNYTAESAGYYQMAFLPSRALDLQFSHKVAVLFDYDTQKSNIARIEIINGVKTQLKSILNEHDCFNLIFSNLNIRRMSETWLSADPAIIENTFSQIGGNPFSNYSNLPSLLSNGIDFIQKNGNDGSIVLITDSDKIGEYQPANELITDLLNLMKPTIPIHVVDFKNQNYTYYYIGGQYYYGNEYLYNNITRLTSANYYNLRSAGGSYSDLLCSAFQSLSGVINSFDLHTKLEEGFCYGRFNVGSVSQSVIVDRPILQIGKYHGAFPLKIEASGVFRTTAFAEQFSAEENPAAMGDTLMEEMWVGNYIKSLESKTQSNDVISEIVFNSVNNRVLSIYSAFLCLEPARGGEVCYDCLDEVKLSVKQSESGETDSDTLLQAYPNPFNSRTIIKFKVPKLESDDISIRIFNILGQVVRSYQPTITTEQRQVEFAWDGTDDHGTIVSCGTYFIVVLTPEKRYSMKVLFVK